MALDTDTPSAPLHLDILAGSRLPRGFRWGAHYSHPAGKCYYAIRNRDGAAVIVRQEDDCVDVLPSRELAARLNSACDAMDQPRGRQ